MKELVETLAGQRGSRDSHVVTFGELPALPDVGDDRWSLLPYVNGWTDYTSTYVPCGFRKLSSGLVILRGLVMNGSAAHICTLPVGYRPGIQMLYIAETSPNIDCRLDLSPAGVLTHSGGSAGWISVCNVCFLAEN